MMMLDAASVLGPIFPCNGKAPRTNRGFYDASSDPDQIRRWDEQHPGCDWAVRTGVVVDVLDIDHPSEIEGTDDMPWSIDMPGGPVARTGGGGWHFYVKASGLGCRTRFSKYCDWKGDGGYVILPPSLHASGNRYEWFSPMTLPLKPCPAELLELVAGPAVETRVATAATRSVRAGSRDPFVRGSWSPAGIIGQMAMAMDGTRNNTLVWAANKIGLDYHARKATRAEAEEALERLHDVALRTGLEDRAIEATIGSGYLKGVRGFTNDVKL